MTTTTDPTALDALRHAETKAVDAATRAQEKARAAEQARQDAEADRARRQAAAREAHMSEQRKNYRATYGGTGERAWEDFLNVVREGGDSLAAWLTYREVRIRAHLAWREFRSYFDQQERAHNEDRRKRLSELNSRGGILDTTPRENRGPSWSARLAAWNADVAEFTGEESRSPAAHPGSISVRIPADPTGFPQDRDGSLDDETYSAGLDRAVRIIEQELRTTVKAEQTQALALALDAAQDAAQ